MSAATHRVALRLAEDVLPVLFERLAAARLEVEALTARLLREPRDALADAQRATEIETAWAAGDGLGWTLGVLAAATGSNLILARRERRGARLVVDLIGALFARRCVTLVPDAGALPEESPRVGHGWELSFACGALFHAAGGALPGETALCWALAREPGGAWCLSFEEPRDGARLAEVAAALRDLLPALAWHADAARWSARFPGDWFVD